MTDLEYLNHAEGLLRRVEAQCDRLNETTDADIDNQRVGGMITLAFADASQIVINLQKPLQEVWLAARSGGYHYKFVDGAWRDTKSGEEFFARLSQSASASCATDRVAGSAHSVRNSSSSLKKSGNAPNRLSRNWAGDKGVPSGPQKVVTAMC